MERLEGGQPSKQNFLLYDIDSTIASCWTFSTWALLRVFNQRMIHFKVQYYCTADLLFYLVGLTTDLLVGGGGGSDSSVPIQPSCLAWIWKNIPIAFVHLTATPILDAVNPSLTSFPSRIYDPCFILEKAFWSRLGRPRAWGINMKRKLGKIKKGRLVKLLPRLHYKWERAQIQAELN